MKSKTKAAEGWKTEALGRVALITMGQSPDSKYYSEEENGGLAQEDRISQMVDLTQKIFLAVERELRLSGFLESIPARNKLKADLQKILLASEFKKFPGLVSNRAQIISRIMEIAEKNNEIILYAA